MYHVLIERTTGGTFLSGFYKTSDNLFQTDSEIYIKTTNDKMVSSKYIPYLKNFTNRNIFT